MNQTLTPGFNWKVELIKDGVVTDVTEDHNIMPTEGMNHLLNVLLKSGTQIGSWYVGIYNANYTPVLGDTAATFPGTATENVAYSQAQRPVFTAGTVAGGALDNSASVAEFTSTANATVYGGFIASSAVKGGTTGVLLSAVKFSTSKNFEAGSILRVTAGFTLTS